MKQRQRPDGGDAGVSSLMVSLRPRNSWFHGLLRFSINSTRCARVNYTLRLS